MIEHVVNQQMLSSEGTRLPVDLNPTDVRDQLRRMCDSRIFSGSPRLRRFLEFTVEQTIGGQPARIKEYLIGIEVFGKPETFDPRLDSIVRVEARRLRAKINRYYSTDGINDEVAILFQAGHYVPRFVRRVNTPDESTSDGTNRQKQVTIVTDEPAQVADLQAYLVNLGYQVSLAAGSSAAGGVLLKMGTSEPSHAAAM